MEGKLGEVQLASQFCVGLGGQIVDPAIVRAGSCANGRHEAIVQAFFLVQKMQHFNTPLKGPRTGPSERLKHIASSFDQPTKSLIRCSAKSTSIRPLGSKTRP
jgi:hypothetical protein